DGVAHGGGHLQVVAGGGAVGVHDVQNDLAGAERLGLLGPVEDVHAGRGAAAVDENFPRLDAVLLHPVGVEAEDGGAAAELAGDLGDQLRVLHGRGVDAYLLGPR